MTGNAFQAFLTRADQEALLARVRAHLHDEGLFAFETRNPRWASLETRAEEADWPAMASPGRGCQQEVTVKRLLHESRGKETEIGSEIKGAKGAKGAKRAKGRDTDFFPKQLSATSGNVSAVVSVRMVVYGWWAGPLWFVGVLIVVYCALNVSYSHRGGTVARRQNAVERGGTAVGFYFMGGSCQVHWSGCLLDLMQRCFLARLRVRSAWPAAWAAALTWVAGRGPSARRSWRKSMARSSSE